MSWVIKPVPLSSGDADLTHQLPVPKYKEFQAVTQGINQFTTTLRTIVVEVNNASSELRLQAQQSREKAEENVAQIDQQNISWKPSLQPPQN